MEVSQEDFREMLLDDMRADANEELSNHRLEYKLRTDYEYFRAYYEDAFNSAMESLKELKRLHGMYELDWDIRTLGDEI